MNHKEQKISNDDLLELGKMSYTIPKPSVEKSLEKNLFITSIDRGIQFCKKYKSLAVSLVVSLVILVRESELPLLVNFTPFRILFIHKNEIIAEFLRGIIISYVAAIVFFYVVNFLNEWNNSKKAKEVLKPFAGNLYCYLNELVGILELAKQVQNVDKFDDIKFYINMSIYYKYRIGDRDYILTKKIFDETCRQNANRIKQECSRLFRIPVVNNLEETVLLDIIKLAANSCLEFNISSKLSASGVKLYGLNDLYILAKTTIYDLSTYYEYDEYKYSLMNEEERGYYSKLTDCFKGELSQLSRNAFIFIKGCELRM